MISLRCPPTLHTGDASFPARDDGSSAEAKHQRFARVLGRAIELPPVPVRCGWVIEESCVVNGDDIATTNGRALADHQIRDL
jgi:hypothetical protein